MRQVLEVFGGEIIPTKKVCVGFLFGIFVRIDLFIDVVLQVIVENIMFKDVVMVFNYGLSRNMKNAV